MRPGSDPATGVLAAGIRSLQAGLHDMPGTILGEMAALSTGQLVQLAKAAALIKQAAQDEITRRPPSES